MTTGLATGIIAAVTISRTTECWGLRVIAGTLIIAALEMKYSRPVSTSKFVPRGWD